MKFLPDPHQVRAFDFAMKSPYNILALEMGLGKTFTTLYIQEFLKSRKRGRTLIICPSYLIPTWEEEINKHCDPSITYRVFDSGNSIHKKIKNIDIVITSYNLVQKAEFLFRWAYMVAIDEAHSLKSLEAKRTSFIHRCIYEYSVPRLTLLTGTPIKNRVMEYYSLVALCNYNPKKKTSKFLEKFPDAIKFADYFSNREQFSITINGRRIPRVEWNGVRKENVAELKKWLAPIYFRVKSSDVLELERPIIKDILISKTPNTALLRDFNAFFEEEGNSKTNVTKKVEAAIQKVPFTVKYVEDAYKGGEMDCCAIYTDSVEACEKLAAALKVSPITGKIDVKKRHAIADRFKAGKDDFIVATIGSFSQGIDLTRSNNLVFNDFSWVPGDMDQVIFRIQRRNQTRRCIIHKIHGSPQDKYIDKKLQEKREVIKEVT